MDHELSSTDFLIENNICFFFGWKQEHMTANNRARLSRRCVCFRTTLCSA